ncbi:MAG: hypothetical protein HY040_10505 [Planctomycetes bacterium]|nr:hypothetical protein [Planctomycetota bacterium]
MDHTEALPPQTETDAAGAGATHAAPGHEGEHGGQEHGGEAHGEGHGGGHAPHGKAHGGGHGGGHNEGGSWIVTYCDMITLLIAFFICIMTFASKESGKEKYPKLRDSILYGLDGSGPTGPSHKGSDADSIVWRQVLTSSLLSGGGSRIPPLYSDPQDQKTSKVLAALKGSELPNLGETLILQFPLTSMFDGQNQLTPAGTRILNRIAQNLRKLPYQVYCQAPDEKTLPLAVRAYRQLVEEGGLEPANLGVGIRLDQAPGLPALWVSFVPRQGT